MVCDAESPKQPQQDQPAAAQPAEFPTFFYWNTAELKFEKFLGRGTYGYVCQVVEARSNMRFAVKISNNPKGENSNMGDIMEEYCLRDLRHPNIVQAFGVVATSTQQEAGMLLALGNSSLSFFLRANTTMGY